MSLPASQEYTYTIGSPTSYQPSQYNLNASSSSSLSSASSQKKYSNESGGPPASLTPLAGSVLPLADNSASSPVFLKSIVESEGVGMSRNEIFKGPGILTCEMIEEDDLQNDLLEERIVDSLEENYVVPFLLKLIEMQTSNLSLGIEALRFYRCNPCQLFL